MPEQREQLNGNSISWSPEQIAAFRRRQREDQKRFEKVTSPVIRRKPFHERNATEYEKSRGQSPSQSRSRESTSSDHPDVGEERWRDDAGDRLSDFGVDDEAEFYDEEDMPLTKSVKM